MAIGAELGYTITFPTQDKFLEHLRETRARYAGVDELVADAALVKLSDDLFPVFQDIALLQFSSHVFKTHVSVMWSAEPHERHKVTFTKAKTKVFINKTIGDPIRRPGTEPPYTVVNSRHIFYVYKGE